MINTARARASNLAGGADPWDTLGHLLAHGTVVASLPPRSSTWSPEKRLAGAILASALVEIRDHQGDHGHGQSVRENLEWLAADDFEWPFSFVRLCQIFDLEPSWVRATVRCWTEGTQLRQLNDLDTPTHPDRRTIHGALA